MTSQHLEAHNSTLVTTDLKEEVEEGISLPGKARTSAKDKDRESVLMVSVFLIRLRRCLHISERSVDADEAINAANDDAGDAADKGMFSQAMGFLHGNSVRILFHS